MVAIIIKYYHENPAIKMRYARIIDKGECMSTLNLVAGFPWPEPYLKKVANKQEWAKYHFYPSNGLVAIVTHEIEFNQVYSNTNVNVFILKINDYLYVPMTIKGIEFISEKTYINEYPHNEIRDMDSRQEKINDKVDLFNGMLRGAPKYIGGRYPFGLEKEADIYCNSAKFSLATHADIYDSSIKRYAQYFTEMEDIHLSKDVFIAKIINMTKLAVIQHGWDIDDEDGIAFYLGLYIKGWCKALDKPSLFDDIFKEAFIKYLREIELT